MNGLFSAVAHEASKRKAGFWEWYAESRKRQIRYWGALGLIFGTVLGKMGRKVRKHTGVFGDYIVVTEYSISKDNVKEFEKKWNTHAKMTQTQEGYVGTKLFKVLNRDWTDADGAEENRISLDDKGNDNRDQQLQLKNVVLPSSSSLADSSATDKTTIEDRQNKKRKDDSNMVRAND